MKECCNCTSEVILNLQKNEVCVSYHPSNLRKEQVGSFVVKQSYENSERVEQPTKSC
jgi:hypothetical protein